MAATPRLYLFYGNDSRASGMAVRRWREVYEQKYGHLSLFVWNADEMTPLSLKSELNLALGSVSLFPEPKLIIIKRLSNKEKGKSFPYSQAVLEFLKENLSSLDNQVTVAIWEEKNLSATHPLLNNFKSWEKEGLAKIQYFPVPGLANVKNLARRYLDAHGLSLDEAAANWIVQQYIFLEKEARLRWRLKYGEELPEDDRSWWLYQTLETASLRARNGVVSKEALEAGSVPLSMPVGVFEIAAAMQAGAWAKAKNMLRQWEIESVDESAYYGLYAALKWQFRKSGQRSVVSSDLLERLLVEVEIIGKNYAVGGAWLTERLLARLWEAAENKGNRPIMEYKKLWLAQLSR